MIEITAYKCEHCGKKYESKAWAEKHEPKCLEHPDNKVICHGCNFLAMVEAQHTTFDHNGNDSQAPVNVLYCAKLGSYVYPPTVKNPYLAENLEEGERDNIPMRGACEHFTEKEYL